MTTTPGVRTCQLRDSPNGYSPTGHDNVRPSGSLDDDGTDDHEAFGRGLGPADDVVPELRDLVLVLGQVARAVRVIGTGQTGPCRDLRRSVSGRPRPNVLIQQRPRIRGIDGGAPVVGESSPHDRISRGEFERPHITKAKGHQEQDAS